MDDFVQQLYTILSSTGEALLNGAGSVSHLKCAMYLCLGYLDLRDPVRPVMRRRWLIK